MRCCKAKVKHACIVTHILAEKSEFEPPHLASMCDKCAWIEENQFNCRKCGYEQMPKGEYEIPDGGWICRFCSKETE